MKPPKDDHLQDTDENSCPPSKIYKKTNFAGNNKLPDKGRRTAAGASALSASGAPASAASRASTSARSSAPTLVSSEASTSATFEASTSAVPVETPASVHDCYRQNNYNDNDGDCSNNDEDDDNVRVHNLQNRKKKLTSLRSVKVQTGSGNVRKKVVLPNRKLLLTTEIEMPMELGDNAPIAGARITDNGLPTGQQLMDVDKSPTADNKTEKGMVV